MPGTRDYQQGFERARKEVRILPFELLLPHTTWSMPSLKGHLPALFLEHTLTFELMHRYNLRLFVRSLWLEPQGKSKIGNLVDFIWELGILVGPLRIVPADFSVPRFSGSTTLGIPLKATCFDVLTLRPQRADKRRKAAFRVIILAIFQSNVVRDCRETTLVADWRKCIPAGLCAPIRLGEGDMCHFVWSARLKDLRFVS